MTTRSLLVILASSIFWLSSAPRALAYRVGVDYHATTDNFAQSAFISQYHDPAVRSVVLSQLQTMANEGISIISTRLWFMDPPNQRFPNEKPRLGFPPTTQEIANIRQFVSDVKEIKKPDGSYLDQYIVFMGSGCSTSWDNPYPACVYTWEQRMMLWDQTHTEVINAVGDLTHPDGTKAISRIYFGGEWMATLVPKVDDWIKEKYPKFVQQVQSKGITPSIYFIINTEEQYILQTDFVDGTYPMINGRHELYWLIRSITYMRDNNLPLPARIDFSFYPSAVNSTYEILVKKTFDDLTAVFPNTKFGVAETYYPTTNDKRKSLGQAFLDEASRRNNLEEIIFWTTPNSGQNGENAGFPFDIKSYLPYVEPTAPTNLTVTGNTITWSPGAGGNFQYLRVGTDQAVVKAGCPNGVGGTTGCFFKSEALATILSTFTLPDTLLPGTLYYWRVVNRDSVIVKDTMISATSTGATRNPADISGKDGSPDGTVDAYDYTRISLDYGKSGAPGFSIADIYGENGIPDGEVDMYDYSFFVSNYGK